MFAFAVAGVTHFPFSQVAAHVPLTHASAVQVLQELTVTVRRLRRSPASLTATHNRTKATGKRPVTSDWIRFIAKLLQERYPS